MSNKIPCSHHTRRGRPCRSPAADGTEPPACARHRDRPAPRPSAPERAAPAPRHFYFPNPTADELRAIEAGGGAVDLSPEVALVRVMLRRLLAYLDEAAAELPPDELRRISCLVFTGARTVAQLLAHRAARPEELQNWLADALAEMSADLPIDL